LTKAPRTPPRDLTPDGTPISALAGKLSPSYSLVGLAVLAGAAAATTTTATPGQDREEPTEESLGNSVVASSSGLESERVEQVDSPLLVEAARTTRVEVEIPRAENDEGTVDTLPEVRVPVEPSPGTAENAQGDESELLDAIRQSEQQLETARRMSTQEALNLLEGGTEKTPQPLQGESVPSKQGAPQSSSPGKADGDSAAPSSVVGSDETDSTEDGQGEVAADRGGDDWLPPSSKRETTL